MVIGPMVERLIVPEVPGFNSSNHTTDVDAVSFDVVVSVVVVTSLVVASAQVKVWFRFKSVINPPYLFAKFGISGGGFAPQYILIYYLNPK